MNFNKKKVDNKFNTNIKNIIIAYNIKEKIYKIDKKDIVISKISYIKTF